MPVIDQLVPCNQYGDLDPAFGWGRIAEQLTHVALQVVRRVLSAPSA